MPTRTATCDTCKASSSVTGADLSLMMADTFLSIAKQRHEENTGHDRFTTVDIADDDQDITSTHAVLGRD